MARWKPICLYLPASWHINLRLSTRNVRRFIMFIFALTFLGLIFIFSLDVRVTPVPRDTANDLIHKYELLEVTNTKDENLYYGIVVDAGSSGTRVFVYFWPRHIGDSKKLLRIHQMRDTHRKPVVMKIKPGLATLAKNPTEASEYLKPLLDYAASHIPKAKHDQSPLYILATAGMRMLPASQQEAILQDLKMDIPKDYKFLFSDKQVEVISGKQEGVYSWIGINYVLGRFDHANENDAMVEVDVAGENGPISVYRKRTVGILDMGGGSAQIAFEVPHTEDVAKGLLAEFNLGCDVHKMEHVYRVYVTTFLGYGGNAARGRYEKALINTTLTSSKSTPNTVGLIKDSPVLDPCLPVGLQDKISRNDHTVHLKGTGDFKQCQASLVPLLNQSVPCGKQPCSFNGVFQPKIEFSNSAFYGFSEYWYCMEDVLRMGGVYDYDKFEKAAKGYCATQWSLIQEHHEKGLYTKADEHRLKYQCFKSAWITTVLHKGFRFPKDYRYLRSASLIQDKEVQWTLGAILHRTRFFPLGETQAFIFLYQDCSRVRHKSITSPETRTKDERAQWNAFVGVHLNRLRLELRPRDLWWTCESLETQQGVFQRQVPPPWIHASQVSNQYILVTCFIVVCICIFLYLRWLRVLGPRQLPRVPTMAYFMTEEGQIQEGVEETEVLMMG